MNVCSLQLNQKESDFLINVRKKSASYLTNRLINSSGFVILKNNIVENISLEFELEILKKNEFFKNDLEIYNQNKIHFKSISYQNINPNVNFIKGYLTINKITKIIELEAYIKVLLDADNKSKVVIELIGEINKKAFNIGVNEKISINSKTIGNIINVEGNFEFYGLK